MDNLVSRGRRFKHSIEINNNKKLMRKGKNEMQPRGIKIF